MRLKGLSTWLIGLGLTLAIMLLAGLETRPGLTARNAVHDAFIRADPRPPHPDKPVRIIDIDETSLSEFGQWPWPRTLLATMVRELFDLGAVAIGFDVIFPEADRTSPSRSAGSPDGLDYDAVLAAALESGPTVLAVVGAQGGAAPAAKAGIAWTGDDPTAALTAFPGHVGNLDILTASAGGLGSISLAPSADGLVRRIPMLTVIGGQTMPSLSAEMLRVAQGAGGYLLRTSQASGEGSGGAARPVALRIGAATVPLDGRGQLTVHFARPGSHPTTSAAALLQPGGADPALRDAIEGRLVLIGSSAAGLYDIRATPVSSAVPGVTLHAEALEQMLQDRYLTRPDWMTGLEAALIALAGLVLTITLVRDRPILGLALMTAIVVGSAAGGFWAMQRHGLLFDPVGPALAGLVVFLPGAAVGVLTKERSRRAIRARFAHFLPPDVLAQVVDDPSGTLTPQGAERDLTVMFVDMRRFSTVTEKMAPGEVVTLVNTYLREITQTLLDHGATIDKFMGDAVMAFWNAPLDTPGHEARAVLAARALIGTTARINGILARDGVAPIGVGVGVNTGPCAVGLMGSEARLSYTCIGDTVNLAARLEGLTRAYGAHACFGGSSLHGMPADMQAVELDVIAVKGRAQAEQIYTVLPRDARTEAFDTALQAARATLLARDWDRAEQKFTALADRKLPDFDTGALVRTYLDRIQVFRDRAPPADWDGSAVAHTK